MQNPYLLPERSVISFSGGRTSGYMLRQIIDAHGGKLPDTVRVVFCNTGKEREETLEFVERCSQRWDVPITWLEYRWEPRHYFVEVDYATASRNGEPFRMAIQARSFLPNPVMRFCTAELKIRTTNRFVRQVLGWDEYRNAIGFRHDEQKRIAKMLRKAKTVYTPTLWDDWVMKETVRGADLPPGETPVFPLDGAEAVIDTVMGFWLEQRQGIDLGYWLKMPPPRPGWDLCLRQDEGNCDLCFLKGAMKLVRILEQRPELAEWWIETETLIDGREQSETARFRSDRPQYSELLAIAQGKQEGPGWLWSDQGNVGACGEIDECRCTD